LGTTGSTTGAQAGNILGNILGAVTNTNTIGNILSSVLGADKPTETELIGTWRYNEPGVAFTSSNTLAKAGGEVVATEIKNKLKDKYSSFGFSNSNTILTFNSNHKFSAKIAGKSLSGTYSYDQDNGKLTLSTLLFSIPCYAKRTTTGISYLFESKKMLSLLQTVATISGNSTAQTIGDLSKNYDGVRLGFDMKK